MGYLLDAGLEDLSFEPDPRVRRQLTEFVHFEGDNDLRIRIRRDVFEASETFYSEWDDARNQWTITIRTAIWEQRYGRGRR